MSEYLIKADNISIIKSGKTILDNISLHIAKKDFITIIGPNGAGKSMLLKTLIRNQKPNMGKINWADNLKIGYVPQRFGAGMTMPITVRYFLSLNKDFLQKEFDEIVAETHISHLLSKQLDVLSGGEMQRVLLARSLLNKPDMLILDEPAQNLDIIGQEFFYKFLEKIYRHYQIAILMVSHDLHWVMSCTNNVLCLNRHICCSGPPKIISQNPEFISLFGQEMSRLMSFYQHYHDDKGQGCHHD